MSKQNEEVFYDLWLDSRWIGMSKGNTPEDARKYGENSLGKERMDKVKMTEFMGCGTSHATYQAALAGTVPFY
jgi:hypothetical protein